MNSSRLSKLEALIFFKEITSKLQPVLFLLSTIQQMKNHIIKIFFLFLFFLSTVVSAQSKGVGIGYQVVINKPDKSTIPGRVISSSPLANTNICLRFTFLDDTKIIEYQEVIKVQTDEFGMVNTFIGKEIQTDGYAASFDAIMWNTIDKTLVVELDTSGLCSNYEEISNQAFASTPFAYNAVQAANVTGIVDIANGGTAARTLDEARINLGVAHVDNTSDIDKPISKATHSGLDTKLNKVLNFPEVLVTTIHNTLAIKGLQESTATQNQVVTINPLTGVLSKSSFISTVQENVANYKAIEGQVLFTTPSPIANIDRINVYRNGIRINASVIDMNTIKLEAGASCYLDDEVKIIQLN